MDLSVKEVLEDFIEYEKKLSWFQLLKDFSCIVPSTWTNNEDNRGFHTWRASGSLGRQKHLDAITGLKNLRSVTWYLNQVSICTWDHFPVISREDGEGLVRLHDRLVKAAAEIKATTTSSRNRKIVPEEIRQVASNAAKCRDPVRRRHLRKVAHKVRREFEAGKAVLPTGKVINRRVVTKLGARDERTEKIRPIANAATTTKKKEWRSSCSPAGASGDDHRVQGSAGTRWLKLFLFKLVSASEECFFCVHVSRGP